jgi:hypothetical protein
MSYFLPLPASPEQTLQAKHTSNNEVPLSCLPNKPYNFLVWAGSPLVLCSCLACPGKCLFWNGPLSEWLNVFNGHSYIDEPYWNQRYDICFTSHWEWPSPLSKFRVCFKEGVKTMSRFMKAINRVLGLSQLCVFMFLSCAATVVGNYRCVGENGYSWTVPPSGSLFAQAQHWWFLNS